MLSTTNNTQLLINLSSKMTICLSALFLFILCSFLCGARGHGSMTVPLPRGSLSTKESYVPGGFDPSAPVDIKPHFPAGNKTAFPGSGLRSQMYSAGPPGWVPFLPLSSLFRWRYGVCGDPRSPNQEHLRGGKYYHNAKIVGTYVQGEEISIEVKINAHHNGFIEIHLCDVDKCNGEISENCFKKRHCVQLQRAPDEECDSGMSKRCGPIDRNYPGRWYFPCSTVPNTGKFFEIYGENNRISYLLPKDLSCEHCVLQWFWTAANSCNPPGVIEYFDGPDGPKNWGDCPGQGGAKGGVARNQGPCGKERFAEEYLQCSDIKVLPEKGSDNDPTTEPSPTNNEMPSTTPSLSISSDVAMTPSVEQSQEPFSKPSMSAAVSQIPSESIDSTTSPAPVVTPEETIAPSPSKTYKNKRRPYGKYNVTEGRAKGWRAIRDIVLIGDSLRIVSLYDMHEVDISMFKTVSIEALTKKGIKNATFFVNGDKVFEDKRPRFYISGKESTRDPKPWVDLDKYRNRWVKIMVAAGGDVDSILIKLNW